jgi:hypothetical protein
VFVVTDSMVAHVKKDPNSPFGKLPSIKFDFQLAAAKDALSGRVGADPSPRRRPRTTGIT